MPCFHLSNGYIKRKLWVYRAQKCITLVGAETVLTCTDLQTTPFRGWHYMADNRNLESSGLPIPMVPHLHQSIGYIKWKLRVWRAQKLCCSSPWKNPTYMCGSTSYPISLVAKNGNMRNFGPTDSHDTTFAPKQCLYQKETMGMESLKMYCSSRCRNTTYQCGAANFPVS